MPLPFNIPVTVVPSVIAGVVVGVATVPENPFPVTTEAEVTDPVAAAVQDIFPVASDVKTFPAPGVPVVICTGPFKIIFPLVISEVDSKVRFAPAVVPP